MICFSTSRFRLRQSRIYVKKKAAGAVRFANGFTSNKNRGCHWALTLNE